MAEFVEIKRDNARAQKNSGRGKYQKGDAIMEPFLVDYKEAARSFTINKNVWSKICTDTFRVSRTLYPCLKLIIGEGNDKIRLAVIEWSYLQDLIENQVPSDDRK